MVIDLNSIRSVLFSGNIDKEDRYTQQEIETQKIIEVTAQDTHEIGEMKVNICYTITFI